MPFRLSLARLSLPLVAAWSRWNYRDYRPFRAARRDGAGSRWLLPAILAIVLPAIALLFVSNSRARSANLVSNGIAMPTVDFLDSIGIVSTFPDRGQPVERTIEMVRYAGFRWVRAGIEGLTEEGPTNLKMFLRLHRETGVRFSWGLGSGGHDLPKLLESSRTIARSGALLAFEGNNEPNNWPVTYKGATGGGLDHSWLPLARLQRDLYQGVKSDPLLARYPVWSLSEPGAQTDNVGLQFLQIPKGAALAMPDGTRYADFANVHNYIYHPHSPDPQDNKVWNAADPGSGSKVDGLYGNFSRTWRKWFGGYSESELERLPRVTTETGTGIVGQVTEEMQGLNLLTMYLAQFKRGYTHTSIYLLRDRTDESGNQTFGFFRPDYSPRRAATYLHNLTTILADKGRVARPGRLGYAIREQPETVHDLLLQHSSGTFQLIVWGERLKGEDRVTITLGSLYKSATIYDPTKGAAPTARLQNVRSIDLTISNHPYVIAISP
jgi:hypothetical protein